MATKKRKVIDWERIEAQYRAGVMSLREIAAPHGITEGAIRKRAKRDAWPDRGGDAANGVGVSAKLASAKPLAGYVYVLGLNCSERFFKIGMTKAFHARQDNHQCASPFELFVACAYFVPNMRAEERKLHEMFESKRVRGEWFRLDHGDLLQIAARCLLVRD